MSSYSRIWNGVKSRVLPKNQEIVEHGWEQHVLIDHKNGLVYRYPRNQNAAAKLADEVQLLAELNEQTWPVEIPLLIEHTEHYSVYRLIEGDVLRPEVIQATSDRQMAEIGANLGVFLAQLHKTDHGVVDRKKTKQTISLFEYYEGRIRGGEDSAYYSQAMKDLEDLTTTNNQPQVVVHGDLHGLNMVIDPKRKLLRGVIDFSEVEIGDPHQDFRKLFMADERLLAPSIEAYAQNGGPRLSIDRVRLWAYVNEWANVCHFNRTPENPTYQRAIKHLSTWGKV